MKIRIIIRKVREDLFLASAAELAGCHVQARNEETARALLKEAIHAYVKSYHKHNEKVPVRTK